MLERFPAPWLFVGIVFLWAALPVVSQENYQKALQMSMYFYECQESGRLSPGNRCPWRAESFMNGRDTESANSCRNRDLCQNLAWPERR